VKTKQNYLWLGVAVLCVGLLFPAVDGANAGEKQHQFIGVAKCKTCHKKEASGAQWVKWSESVHAGAYKTLAGEASMKIAKEKGIANPQEADECLRCHVTGHGAAAELLGTKYSVEDGVGCESCHGAGGGYYKKTAMKAITAGTEDGAKLGLVTPDEKLCVTCHNAESPTFKAFDFKEMAAKIAHPFPEGHRDKVKAAAAGGSK
jgi:hypothetical protein